MQWLWTWKYIILLTLLIFQNLWNLINVLKIYENVYLNVFYFFQSSMGPRKSSCDIPSDTTQGWACPNNIDACDCRMCYFACAKGATF